MKLTGKNGLEIKLDKFFNWEDGTLKSREMLTEDEWELYESFLRGFTAENNGVFGYRLIKEKESEIEDGK